MAAGVIVAFIGSSTLRWSPPPLPPRSVALSGAQLAAGARGAAGTGTARGSAYLLRPMARSVPASLYIPRIQAPAEIISLGLTPRRASAVPPLASPFLTRLYHPG